MDQEYQKMFYLFGCAAIVAEIAVNLPYEALFEWVNSSHLCLPIATLQHKKKAELREKTIFVSSLKQPTTK
jgi:hypothetical protein